MSQLTGILRQITKKAPHPNALLYTVQLERARQKILLQGQLDDGKEGAIALGAVEKEGQEQETGKSELDTERGNGMAAERDGESEGVEGEGAETERRRK
jgi:hypothetical protein